MTQKQELKLIVVARASSWSGLTAKKAAEMVYASITGTTLAFVEKLYPDYNTDSGDAACAAFTRWIREDRKR